jgi:putative ABC transport system ATP-binding protein
MPEHVLDQTPSLRTENRELRTDLIVDARGVRKTYRGGDVPVEALRGVDFAVRRGEMVAIMGPSGCGKTTLLNCLSGIDSIDGGEIEVDGQSLQRLSDKALTRYRARAMGFVFQSYNLLSVLSAVENVEMPLLVAGAPPAAARSRERIATCGIR